MAHTRFIPFAFFLAAACGGSSDDAGGVTQQVRFSIFKGGENVDCATVPEITSVTGRLLESNGTLRAGGDASCESGVFVIAGAPAGSYAVELVAKGTLGSDTNATLFTARSDITLPEDDGIELSLRPEIAYLDLTWNFGSEGLGPCADLVDYVSVTVGTGNTQGGNFTREYDCTASPVSIPQPFELTEHFVKVEAYNFQGFIDWSTEARRVFDRGDNAYTAMLQPIGGTLLLDWIFSAGLDVDQSCDASFVQVDEVVATVRALDGGSTTSERIDCATARPYVYRGRRYAPGRELELTLVGEGASRFVATQTFTMPNQDYAPGAITLEAVGTATVAIEVRTSTCTSPDVERFDVTVFEKTTPLDEVMVFEGSVAADASTLALPPLPYAEYRVEVVEQGPVNPICTLDEPRMIDQKENAWAPFVF